MLWMLYKHTVGTTYCIVLGYPLAYVSQCRRRLHGDVDDEGDAQVEWRCVVGAARHLQEPLRNQGRVLPLRSADVSAEVWVVDLRRLPGSYSTTTELKHGTRGGDAEMEVIMRSDDGRMRSGESS